MSTLNAINNLDQFALNILDIATMKGGSAIPFHGRGTSSEQDLAFNVREIGMSYSQSDYEEYVKAANGMVVNHLAKFDGNSWLTVLPETITAYNQWLEGNIED